MTPFWNRAARWLTGLSMALFLAACGDSTVSDLRVERFVVLGDGFSDVGQNGHVYSVNDGSRNWVQEFARHYDLQVLPSDQGGYGYAYGEARLNEDRQDDAGRPVPSVRTQLQQVLERTRLSARGDVVFINGGMQDVIAAVEAHGISDETRRRVGEAGRELGRLVQELADAGARHIGVTGLYNLGQSPWARARELETEMQDLTTHFNDQLLLTIAHLGRVVQYFDAALFYNIVYEEYETFGLRNRREAVCTSPQITACTPATVRDPDYNRFLFAGDLYFTPEAQRFFSYRGYGNNAYNFFRDRW